MLQYPKSLTAVVHIKFHYDDEVPQPVSMADIEMVSNILDKAAGLSSEMQHVLVRFTEFLNNRRDAGVGKGQTPG